MNQLFMPLGLRLIVGAFVSIVLGIIMVTVAVILEFMRITNDNEPLSSSILDGSITLAVGYMLYLFARSVIGKHSAVFILETFPYVANQIEEKIANDSISREKASKLSTSLHSHVNTISALDGFAHIIKLTYVFIIVIFIGLSFFAYCKPMDIDVGKFAIFETVTIIGLYFSVLIYMYTVDKKAYGLISQTANRVGAEIFRGI
jgi:hypothetical protein